MLNQLSLQRFLFIDIETVPELRSYEEMDAETQQLWAKKVERFRLEGESDSDLYLRRTGILAEFSKVVCITLGYFSEEGGRSFRLKSFAGNDEPELLSQVKALFDEFYPKSSKAYLTGHNIKEFDVPFLCRRMLINGIELPNLLNVTGKKPWEVNYIDTLNLWKFGDYKHYTSLKLLCKVLKVPTPKDDMDGSMVGAVYQEENGLERIVNYCQKDVQAVANIILKFRGEPLLQSEEVNIGS